MNPFVCPRCGDSHDIIPLPNLPTLCIDCAHTLIDLLNERYVEPDNANESTSNSATIN